MNPVDPAKRDAAVLALLQAAARLDAPTRIARARAPREAAARQLLALLDVLRPMIAAIEYLVSG